MCKPSLIQRLCWMGSNKAKVKPRHQKSGSKNKRASFLPISLFNLWYAGLHKQVRELWKRACVCVGLDFKQILFPQELQ